MSVLVADCPRCGAERMSFDVKAELFRYSQYGWQNWYELFCVCRNCRSGTIFLVNQKEIEPRQLFENPGALLQLQESLNNFVEVDRFISLRDQAAQVPPEHVPPDIQEAFNEAATCLAVQCYNAAGAMFRLCVDLATRSMLPDPKEEIAGLNAKTRRDLGLRLPWLFDNGKLPENLAAMCDGAFTRCEDIDQQTYCVNNLGKYPKLVPLQCETATGMDHCENATSTTICYEKWTCQYDVACTALAKVLTSPITPKTDDPGCTPPGT